MADPQSQQMNLQQALELALEHHQASRLPQAEALYKQVLAAQPNNPDALHLLGVLAMDVKRYDVAIDLIRRAIAIHPAFADYYSNLGQALAETGRYSEAVAMYRQAIALDPNLAKAHNNLGNALLELGQTDAALTCIRKALELEPDESFVHHNLGGALYAAGQAEQAIASFERAIQLKPDFAPSHSCMGVAMQYYRGELTQAEREYQTALSIDPNFAEAIYHMGMVHLLRGDFQRGWDEYESRFAVKSLNLPKHNFTQPLWNGSDLTGRRILITHEQGMGDTIHFSRYALLLAERGARVIVQCQSDLLRLLRSMGNEIQIITDSDVPPDFDVHSPMLSLPRLCKTTLTGIPNTVPYLHLDREKVEFFKSKIHSDRSGLKVGLVWAGRSFYKNDRHRSIAASELSALREIPGVRFFSLQKSDIPREPPSLEMTDVTSDLHDFADTAALIDQLDLVISVDTAVAHLAGAMGKPVWILLPFMPDWRWMLDRVDSPWYPTARLFRQSKVGDWSGVLAHVADELASLKNQSSS